MGWTSAPTSSWVAFDGALKPRKLMKLLPADMAKVDAAVYASRPQIELRHISVKYQPEDSLGTVE